MCWRYRSGRGLRMAAATHRQPQHEVHHEVGVLDQDRLVLAVQLHGDACMDDLGGSVAPHERVDTAPQAREVDVGFGERGDLEHGERGCGAHRGARVVQQLLHRRQHHVHQRRDAQAGELLQGRSPDCLVRVGAAGGEQAGDHGGNLHPRSCAVV